MREEFGDIFTKTEADAICVTTNGICKLSSTGELVGIMGAGIARAAANRFSYLPGYLANSLMEFGHHTRIISRSKPPQQPYHIVSLPTKYHWKQKSTIVQVRQSVQELFELANHWNWQEVYLTKPGCAHGGLNYYKQVRPILREELDDRFVVIDLKR